MKQYLDLVKHVLDNGTRKPNRTFVDTISTFNYNYTHDLRHGFPLLTTKAVSWKNIVIELLWFLSGQTDISFLRRHGCKFWDAWASPSGEVPSAYGNFWRRFPVHATRNSSDDRIDGDDYCGHNDQIRWAIDELKKNPMSRRVVISAWAPGNAQTSKLPPCHAMFVMNVQNEHVPTHPSLLEESFKTEPGMVLNERDYTRRRLCLHLTQRSCDIALGVPYNLASYALLIHLFARFTNLEPGVFGHSLVDAHVYTSKEDGSMADMDHVPGLREQLQRAPRPLPTLRIADAIQSLADVEELLKPKYTTEGIMSLFALEGYLPHPAIPFKVAV